MHKIAKLDAEPIEKIRVIEADNLDAQIDSSAEVLAEKLVERVNVELGQLIALLLVQKNDVAVFEQQIIEQAYHLIAGQTAG